MVMKKPAATDLCSICKEPLSGSGHNASPINGGRCCDACNDTHVIPAKIANMRKGQAHDDPAV